MNSVYGKPSLSVILPCYNERDTVAPLCEEILALHPDAEVIVVDDGSSPEIPSTEGVNILKHPYNIGNGASIKTGARAASGEVLLFMDADGQHSATDISRLLAKIDAGYDMAIGSRSSKTQASFSRLVANSGFNRLASLMTGYHIEDLTSGFRAVRAKAFKNFLYLLPNRFSYPTTSTMAFYRNGYSVTYVPIEAKQRNTNSQSNIRIFKDGIRFIVIILKIGALFSPMRLFLPISAVLFSIATVYYGYTYFTESRFTNMSALLYVSSLIIFLIGILSEQVSSLHYRNSEERRRRTDTQRKSND
jgi:glycosyltransferase involved in cell wall biosynthesis